MRTTTRPFVFLGCVELRQTLDVHALDERELMHRLEEVPADSVFFHTFGYFLRHRPFTTAYGSDFAQWLREALELTALAERFERIDPYLTTLERVRGRLLSLVDRALEEERA